jgi:hypothetical protein
VLGQLKAGTGADPAAFAAASGAAFALLTALVAAAVFAAAQRFLGPPTGDVACALAAAAPVFLPFAPSLYWVPFLLLAPFALVWCFDPLARTPVRRAALYSAVGVAVGLKALCGYEYITTVILAPVAAAWFHQHRTGESPGRRVRVAAALMTPGLAGFAAAVALHAAQLRTVLGEDGLAAIRDRAAARTAGDLGAEAPPGYDPTGSRLAFAARCFLGYFDQRALSTPERIGVRLDVPLRVVVLGVGAFAAAAWVGRRKLPRDAGALAGATALALAAGASWQVLAVNHMCVHRHLNLVVFAVPFLPVAFVVAGYVVKLAAGRSGFGRRVGPVVLAAVIVLMGVNAASIGREREADRAAQGRAEAAVAARLGGSPSAPGTGSGAVDLSRPADRVPHQLLVEYGQFDPATGGPKDPGALVIQGWAAAGWRPAARPAARVVVACGGSVVRCEVLRFRRPDLEAILGRPLPAVGFVAVVPSAWLKAEEPVRVFAVSAADPDRVAELEVR